MSPAVGNESGDVRRWGAEAIVAPPPADETAEGDNEERRQACAASAGVGEMGLGASLVIPWGLGITGRCFAFGGWCPRGDPGSTALPQPQETRKGQEVRTARDMGVGHPGKEVG